MQIQLSKKDTNSASGNLLIVVQEITNKIAPELSKEELEYAQSLIERKKHLIHINRYTKHIYIYVAEKEEKALQLEKARKAGASVCEQLRSEKQSTVLVVNRSQNKDLAWAAAEGLALANYNFDKYRTKESKNQVLEQIELSGDDFTQKDSDELHAIVNGVHRARTLINEPFSYLNAVQLTKELEAMSEESGFTLKVLDEKKIRSLKMGGLLAVNQGSALPPTFSILEWKPKNSQNSKPVVLVGKGIVFDTGGYSIKPTPNSMDLMKSDMSGAAAVAGLLYAVSKANLPLHIIGLIPSTDNCINSKAYVPGDVITISDGTTVEVLNTDAEGRLILADALVYAKKYSPEIVVDVATLTGAAARITGIQAMVAMGTVEEEIMKKIKESGQLVYERIIEMPLWSEYGEMLKSDIADLKNIGGAEAGAITAGKFLEHFTNYPWIHLDIAGGAFLGSKESYRGKGGTGTAVRLLYHFLKSNYTK